MLKQILQMRLEPLSSPVDLVTALVQFFSFFDVENNRSAADYLLMSISTTLGTNFYLWLGMSENAPRRFSFYTYNNICFVIGLGCHVFRVVRVDLDIDLKN